MLLFGIVEILLSQIPDFRSIEWLSIFAAVMSFSYALIGSGLGFLKVIENGTIKGSISGVPASSNLKKLWLAFEALADVAFAYPYTLIVLEIQDTLNTPGNLLTGFGFYEPHWLVDLANACIVLHLVGAYQIFSQPVFATAERWFAYRFTDSGFLNNHISFKIPLFSTFQLNPFRVVFRTMYVVSTTALAMSFPYFNSVLGVLGALNFWPLAVYFPVEMYLKQKKIRAWSREWICYRTFSGLCLLVTVVGFIGSLEELTSARSSDEKLM
ncbi:hypothetical protein EUGRSUZ_L01972 [Eucalyptus grandis]|uniref:Amino acid transporter transmembrane domain-containing protein n=1 Tax=Eucalyptus grandis TaxID=71139 RepID=A0AAD9T9P4_EUCGR|nr:hypothetical protein EUGRSUZ_L01972 [Eucalyptus grandis]